MDDQPYSTTHAYASHSNSGSPNTTQAAIHSDTHPNVDQSVSSVPTVIHRRMRNVFHVFRKNVKKKSHDSMKTGDECVSKNLVSDSTKSAPSQLAGNVQLHDHSNDTNTNGERGGFVDRNAGHLVSDDLMTQVDSVSQAGEASCCEETLQQHGQELTVPHHGFPHRNTFIQSGESTLESIKHLLATCLLPILIPFGIFYGLFSMLTCLPRARPTTNYNNNHVVNSARTFRPFGRASPSMPTFLLPILLPFMLLFHMLRGILLPLELLSKLHTRQR